MILIDATYVNTGGGLQLLKYLLETLKDRNVDFFLLADARCLGMFDNKTHVCYLKGSLKKRKEFYKNELRDDISSVFCFGNVPPPIHLKIPVCTYFHNINMLTLADCRDTKQLIKFWLKREYIKSQKRNTDEWFVQTSNTANELIKHLEIAKEKVFLYPFYKAPKRPEVETTRTDYIFAGEYSGSKGHDELLTAWTLLHRQGIDRTLHLTVSQTYPFVSLVKQATEEGVSIVNHGCLPPKELSKLYLKCKATVYPSKNESFGLGLVEAMELGCDVIGSDLPFIHVLCEPSEVFNPSNPESIADAVIRYEKDSNIQTIQLVQNRIDEMIVHILGNKDKLPIIRYGNSLL